MSLTEQQRAILDFETSATWWRNAGAKENAIREKFGISSIRYHQILNRCLDDPEAVAYSPTTVRRLQRIHTRRAHRHDDT
ncbi:DUF3263 domain-containing protein [Tsukamurella pulmonis]|uniref:DUF3263 domain-containing protein n=1 Tax=Tsukamurella pulmonis TaxID=47312 RepID=UPI001EDEFEAE|nr:DUF3263 domain-containing protein [Tsukamurella pulmonis]